MRRPTPAILSLLLLALLAAPAGASEGGPTSCGGSWAPDRAECTLRYWGGQVGVGISLFGDPAGAAVIRLEGPGPVKGTREVLLTCEAVGTNWGCGASAASNKPITVIGAHLTCIVEGRGGHGSYGCWTGT